MAIQLKNWTLTVIPQTMEAAKELMKLNTFTIADKQIPVTVMDDKVIKDLQAITKVTIPEKEVKVKIGQLKPVTIPDQNVTVNYKTGSVDLEDITDENVAVNYKTGSVDLEDIPDEKNIKVNYEQENLVGDSDQEPLTKKIKLELTTDSQEAFKKINNELNAKGLNTQIKLEPKVTPKVDLKGLNEQAISAKIAEIKKNLSVLTIGSQEWIDLKELEADATAFSNLLQTAIKNGMDVTPLNPEEFWKKIFGGSDIATSELQAMLDQINAYLKEKGLDPIKLNFTTGEIDGKTAKKDNNDNTLQEFTKRATEFIGGLSSVASGLNKLGVELPEGVGKVLNVIQGVTEVINGINAIIQSTQVGAITANTAAVTANTAALGGAAASGAIGGASGALGPIGLAVGGAALLGSVFGLFHNGGIVRAANGYEVPGNYGYDAVPALLTSGELVLNRAQQGVLADALGSTRSNSEKADSQPYIEGEMLFLGLQAYTRRSGMGEIVTANR